MLLWARALLFALYSPAAIITMSLVIKAVEMTGQAVDEFWDKCVVGGGFGVGIKMSEDAKLLLVRTGVKRRDENKHDWSYRS